MPNSYLWLIKLYLSFSVATLEYHQRKHKEKESEEVENSQ